MFWQRHPSNCLASVVAMLCGAIALLNGDTSLFAQQKKRFIELSIIASPQMIVGGQQQWMERLNEVGADRVVIKGGALNAQPGVEEFAHGDTVTLVVTGILNDRQLILPGGRFTANQSGAIRDYLQRLRDDGATVALAEKKAFGLTSEQLVEVHEDLARLVEMSTAELTVREFVQACGQRLQTPLIIAPSARTALSGDERVGVELVGLTTGTSLAYAVRSLGLVLVPRREQGKAVELHLVAVDESQEHWPIGWPVEAPINQNAPVLFERMDFEVRAFPLSDVLAAVQRRMQMPFLVDENALAEKDLILSEIKVTYSKPQAPYLLALDAILRQSKPALQAEPRMDENGTVFLWIY